MEVIFILVKMKRWLEPYRIFHLLYRMRQFDFILDLNNEKLDIKEGYVAVPIYFMQHYDLQIGESIIVKNGNAQKEFIISDYARDYEMNSSLTSSKRFVINRADYDEMLISREGELEYLIQFKLKENGNCSRSSNRLY